MNSISNLARAAAHTQWTEIPKAVRRQAGDLFLDTVAVVSAGLTHPEYAPFVELHCKTPGEATVPGISHGLPLLTAAFVNGGSTTVFQLQDGHRLARGHPASHLVPALLAVAETEQIDCVRMLEAFVSGYEVGTRIGASLDGLNPALHDTGTWSTIATAAGVAHLLTDGDADVIAKAIEASAAVAPMSYRETAAAGASIHHLYVGLGTTAGIAAGTAVVGGLSPLTGTLSAFFGPRAGASFDPEKLDLGIGTNYEWEHYELMNAYIKIHPTCAHLHGINDAVADLIEVNSISADEVARVDVATYGTALEFENAQPHNDLGARFSIPGTVAIALCFGVLTIKSLTNEALGAPKVKDMMKRIHVRHEPNLDQHYPAGRPCEVTITCHDGRKLTSCVIYPLGDCTNPLTGEARRAKARYLLAERFGRQTADNILDTWDVVVAGEPLSCLSDALRSPAGG